MAFSRAVLQDADVVPDGEEGMPDLRIIVAALGRRASGGRWCCGGRRRNRRPEPADRIHRPPVRERRLVGVEAPSQ
jgi:hypothetical protein